MMRKIADSFLVAACMLLCLALAAYAQQAHKKPTLVAKVSGHQVALAWMQGTVPVGAPAVTGNNVYRGATTGTETLLTALVGASVAYTDGTATAGSSYCYETTAVNSAGESGKSNEVCVSIPNLVPPNAPTGLTATAQ